MAAQSKIYGILGGGQLGRMSIEAANRLNLKVAVLDNQPNPAVKLTNHNDHINADFKNHEKVLELAQKSDVLTVEIEHVNCDALYEAKKQNPLLEIHPDPTTIEVIQDKYKQKLELKSRNLPLGEFLNLEINGNELSVLNEASVKFGFPFLLKSKKLAYDGRGNFVIKSQKDFHSGLKALGNGKMELYIEKFVPFVKELAVMVARGRDGEVLSYPVVETIQKNNVCQLVIAPAQIDGKVAKKAKEVAELAISGYKGAGVFGVEMFLLEDGNIYLNEIAPRPHNSGHYTIEACYTSQFENHVRAIAGLPLGNTDMKVPAAIMINILGSELGANNTLLPCTASLPLPGTTVHLYGKEWRSGRKMGHITTVGASLQEVNNACNEILKSISEPNQHLKFSPVVGVIMGSDSDLPKMKAAAEILKEFEVPFEVTIVSAHRTPERMVNYAKSAHERGLKVIIAAAGGAAHLPGMVAAITPLPVIGVPIALKYLDGVDSLHSIVQMPRGVPVATVAIDNSTNAALLAIKILGCHTKLYQDKLLKYQKKQENIVLEKVKKLNKLGWEEYE
ncbi:phosphoribosylaminoimidazole carboxylase ade2 [Clydaea vesicula]|uniref:Phosphoribosylaminoimidazole carboxylase n=1 Tax=Clydaea vesicula TaxID=447962 RepID=A0AAD5UA14_9FUNG|nr:phosphoribosylaminoimidazole carboxylase ade2 [Clydaea vesicula]